MKSLMNKKRELNQLIKKFNAPYLLQDMSKLFISDKDLSENSHREVKGSKIINCTKKFKVPFYKKISKF